MNGNEENKPAGDVRSSDWLACAKSLPECRARLIGKRVALPNGWAEGGEIIGAFVSGNILRLLLAWPSAEDARQLFNEYFTAVEQANDIAERRAQENLNKKGN